jgi:gliding motility-associated-like protein
MEFPPVRSNGLAFINSSPELFPPLSDYACLNDLFYYDFGGKDPDGDSLVYEMVTPLNGNTNALAPLPARPMPAPYLPVTWTAGMGTTNQIPGSPTIGIDKNSGLLTLKPTSLGLFVFGVRCSEYRNKVKIGEIRRDFQLMVLNCPKNVAPKILVKQAGHKTPYQEGDVIRVSAAGNRCLDLFVADTEANAALTLEARPVNFSMTDQIISLKSGTVNPNGVKDTLSTTACFPACLNSAGKTYLMDFIVSDNGCSLPKKDTIRVAFQIEPVPNQAPTLTTTAAAPVLTPRLNETIAFDVLGLDGDNDFVSLTVSGQDFPITGQSMSFTTANGNGQASGRFTWDLDCRARTQASYTLLFTATTLQCGLPVTKTVPVEVRPQSQNLPPAITTTAPAVVLRPRLGEKIEFDVTGTDDDGDLVSVGLTAVDFNRNNQTLAFPAATGPGLVTSRFSWTLDCPAVSQQDRYTLRFTATSMVCGEALTQTTDIEIRPDYRNAPPVMASNMAGKTIAVPLGSTFTDTIFGTDVDLNHIALTAQGEGFDLADRDMRFQPASGQGQARAVFSWNPACQVTPAGQYTVHFTLTETACLASPPQTLSVTFDVGNQEEKPFTPADIFTPNNDGRNDYFELPNLPADFCTSVFAVIKIYNRWGGLVYESQDRNFKWDGQHIADGVYYYQILYSDKQYKGMVTVVR